jgi:PKD repeat protein
MKNRIPLAYILITILIIVSNCKKDPPQPTANFSFTGDNTPAPCEINFTNSSTNANSYFWEFGDGFSSSEENPKHTYNTEGTFSVKLTAEGEGGTNSISRSLTVLEPEPTAASINFTVIGDQDLEQTIYPSVLLGLANLIAESNEDFFDFSLKNPKANSNLKIVIEASNLNSETIFQTQMATKGQIYTFSPLIKWNYANLKSLTQPGNVDLTFVCYINDKEIDRKNLRFSYRSANECVYGYIDSKGAYIDIKWMFAAFVNEDNPKIDELLSEALSYSIVNYFIGYQGTENDVFKQVSALWFYLQAHSVKYSSITASSNPSQKVFSQYVRFFNDVYNNSQANCADGSVFLASILKKIGINPLLITIPGHMYLGYYTVLDKSQLRLLETTKVGDVNLAEIYEDSQYVYNLSKYSDYISDETLNDYFDGIVSLDFVKKEISLNSLLDATNCNIDSYNNNISKFNDPNNHEYKIFDIEALRKIVQPIGNKK